MPNTTVKQTPKERATAHVQAALATGIRGDARAILTEALHVLTLGTARQSPTDLEYRNLKPGQKLADPARAGLLMRCGTRSGRVWFFRHQHPNTGKQTEVKMGAYPADLSVSQARDLWDEMRTARNAGLDPETVLQGTTGGQSPMTVADLVGRYIAEYAKPTKRSWKQDEDLLRRHLVPTYGALPATKFTHKEAAQLLKGIHQGGHHRLAERVRAVISTMYRVAVGKTRKIDTLGGTWLDATTDNPVENVMLPARTAKNHKPTAKEMTALLDALPIMGTSGDILRLQAQIMARVAEVAHMAWAELDLDEGRWVLPAERAKNGHEHLVLLPAQAIDFLRDQNANQDAKGIKSPYVFPQKANPNKPTRSETVIHALSGKRAALGLPDAFKSHSLRHAALTWAAENGATKDLRDRVSNHVSKARDADSIYVAAQLNQPAKELWQRWADYLDTLTQPNVFPIKARA